MATDANIVILDGTASVDSVTEAKINRQSISQKTVIVIAHRLSTIQQADSIVVLEQRLWKRESQCTTGVKWKICKMVDAGKAAVG